MAKDYDVKKINGEWFMYIQNIQSCEECSEDIDFSGWNNIQKGVDKIKEIEASEIKRKR